WYNRIGGKAAFDFKPIEGMKFSAVIAPVYNFNKSKAFETAAEWTLADNPDIIGGPYQDLSSTKLTENRNDDYSVTTQFLGNYDKEIGKHSFNFMVGYENYYQFAETLMASRDQYLLDSYPYLDLGPEDMRDNSGSANEYAYRSVFGRIMYNYANKYLFQANVRRDGSSRFGKDYRWGTFPSFSLGWVMSEESFIKNLDYDWLSFLKLRGSWGQLGNERIGSYYPSLASISFSNALMYDNSDISSVLTAYQQAYAVSDISWETTESVDFGLDTYFLNSRLKVVFDYYHKTTKDMLLGLEIPNFIGFDNPEVNTGSMTTNGFDLEIGWNDHVGDVSYGISANLSDFKSKMGDLGGTEFLGSQVKKEGSEFNEWYGYQSEGLYLTQDEVDNSPMMNKNIKVGDVKYKDISGPDGVPDGLISSEYDRTLLGGSLPRYMFGMNFNLGYKDFDLSMSFQGVGKQNSLISSLMVEPLRENWGNVPAILENNYWSSLNTDQQNATAIYPRLTRSNIGNNYAMSDFWLFNGRYIRLKNLTFGYTLPTELTQKAAIKRMRLYVSGNDLFCLSGFPKGWDPEMGNSSYPITTSLLFGVSINF
ncbi:MAG: SusC/RagA family TonB-linked outer membrane protein, partial [Bacteroidaceae bacterium]|nr:SusC/RagA family TonB-linked outer membrane protein [Bacteroidaceae bacterium]